ncbi:MAG: hypothetical protein ACYSYL_00240 [Planctomycetota bacterium]|jgi:Mn-dependent DtxR family transcriptional regulator
MDEAVTRSQLLAELLEAKRSTSRPEGALRTKTLKKQLGMSLERVRDMLAELKEEGLVEAVQIHMRVLDDKVQPIVHYRIPDSVSEEELLELLGRHAQEE